MRFGPPKNCLDLSLIHTQHPHSLRAIICKSCFPSKSRLVQLFTKSCYEKSRMTGITRMTEMTRIAGMTEMNWTNRVTGTTAMTTKDDLDD